MFQPLRFITFACACALLVATAVSGAANEKPAAQGGVVLTVAGKVENWNRGPMTAARDSLFNQHKVTFEKAMAFDADMLAKLPKQELTLTTPAGNGTFSGPALTDVLSAAGAKEAGIRLLALDGTTVNLTTEQIKSRDWILVLSVDGKPVGIGDFGPLLLLNKPASGDAPTKDELQQWVWSVFYIEVI
jgi:hypothetical protein